MTDTSSSKDPATGDQQWDEFAVPEEPFGIGQVYWKAGLILFSFLLMGGTVFYLMGGGTPQLFGALYLIPAILFAYFYRRRGVLAVYLMSMVFFTAVVIFRYPSAAEIFTAAIVAILVVAIALTVSYLTHYLVREKRKYHAIFDNTENGVALISIADHRILEMNQRFCLSLGLPGPETKDHNLNDFIPDPAPLSAMFATLMTQCSAPAFEIAMRRADGSEWTAVIAARKISLDHAVITFIDFTERRKLVEQLRQLHDDANLYLDILTHDINNINTASLSYGLLLEEEQGFSRSDLLVNLIRSLEKSDEIIRNITTLRKIREDSIRMAPLQLSSIIMKEITGFPDAKIDYDGSNATVLADEMLGSVFDNLISNAIKFGGKDPRVIIRVRDGDTMAEVSVADTGAGIPDSLKPLVFERFQRGDTTVSGKGLGLFICKALIERYGGSIQVEDRISGETGKGAVIRFTIPKA